MRVEIRMTPTKLLVGQILVVLAIIIASIWIATQWAAASLGVQSRHLVDRIDDEPVWL